MIPEKIIETIRDFIPGLTREKIIRSLEHGMQHHKFKGPDQSPLYKLCKAFRTLELSSISDRKALITIVAEKAGLSKQYVATNIWQHDIQLPEHLQYQKKTRSAVVQGMKEAVDPRDKNKYHNLPVEEGLKDRLLKYAGEHGMSLREATREAVNCFLDSRKIT